MSRRLNRAERMLDRLSSDEKFKGKRFVFFLILIYLFENKCRAAPRVFVMCSWDTFSWWNSWDAGGCVMSELDWLGPGARWLPLTPRACRRIWGIGLSRRLPRTRHACAP